MAWTAEDRTGDEAAQELQVAVGKMTKEQLEGAVVIVDWIKRHSMKAGASNMTKIDKEKHADLEHEIWASWMRYMFSCGTHNPDGTWTMPADRVVRWTRQMNTPYSELSDKEKENDIEQVEKHILLIETGEIDRSGGTGGIVNEVTAIQLYNYIDKLPLVDLRKIAAAVIAKRVDTVVILAAQRAEEKLGDKCPRWVSYLAGCSGSWTEAATETFYDMLEEIHYEVYHSHPSPGQYSAPRPDGSAGADESSHTNVSSAISAEGGGDLPTPCSDPPWDRG